MKGGRFDIHCTHCTLHACYIYIIKYTCNNIVQQIQVDYTKGGCSVKSFTKSSAYPERARYVFIFIEFGMRGRRFSFFLLSMRRIRHNEYDYVRN